ncbi:hypothetical protein [Arthrobacter sp. VKM Ac-2550]|uniref:hypothetical protein n=1 Tax=Crystallibacter permensis TaxID=1938888 RepID=UPI002226BAA8|nr:hypothetical protein [Arthrobacter sp. VKM Ac-2550]MCW2131066.1 hypothetical protein [Arthrobacter sp. VKM Ac-2550]
MGIDDITNAAKDATGNNEGGEGQGGGLSDKANDAVDNTQEHHGEKLGGFGDQANEAVDGAQERFGGGQQEEGQ